MEKHLFNKELNVVIIGMHGCSCVGNIGKALIDSHRLAEENIRILDIENVNDKALLEQEFALTKRNLDFEIPALEMVDYVGFDLKKKKKPANPEWRKRMRNLQNLI